MAMPQEEQKPERITLSFSVTLEEYKEFNKRLPGWGDKSSFFRTVMKKYLAGELKVSSEREF
jgi:hypothetical protein